MKQTVLVLLMLCLCWESLVACSYHCVEPPLSVSYAQADYVVFSKYVGKETMPSVHLMYQHGDFTVDQFESYFWYGPEEPGEVAPSTLADMIPEGKRALTLLSSCGRCGGVCFTPGEYYVLFIRSIPLPAGSHHSIGHVFGCGSMLSASAEMGDALQRPEDWFTHPTHEELRNVARQLDQQPAEIDPCPKCGQDGWHIAYEEAQATVGHQRLVMLVALPLLSVLALVGWLGWIRSRRASK